MKHLVLLASIYALIVALVVPGSIFAQDEPAPTVTETTAAEPAPAPAEPAPAEPAPAEAAPAPAQAAPAPAAAPEPQFLADERAEAPDPQPKAIAAASGSVTIADFSFTPGTITINQGDTVTWNNNGPTPHSAKANDGSFDTGILKKGQSGSHTFKEAGTFSYFCQPHPFMKATVVVKAASESAGGDTGGTGSADTGGTDNTGGTSADAAQSDEGPTLPDTGSDSGALLVLGALTFVLGAAIHRRTAASDPRPTGRIGW
jgi:LPXTG-motif cell wall-anchored protein